MVMSVVGVANAQSSQVARVADHIQRHGAFGLKAGLNLSDLSAGQSGTYFSSPKSRLGMVFGAFYNIPFGQSLAFQPELSYSAEGANQDGQLGASNTMVLVAEYKYNYLNLPLMLQYKPHRFYLEAGPQFGFRMAANQVTHTNTSAGNVTTDVSNEVKGMNLSLALGTGYYLSNHFGLGLRYTIGLSEIRTLTGAVQKGNVLSLSALYKF